VLAALRVRSQNGRIGGGPPPRQLSGSKWASVCLPRPLSSLGKPSGNGPRSAGLRVPSRGHRLGSSLPTLSPSPSPAVPPRRLARDRAAAWAMRWDGQATGEFPSLAVRRGASGPRPPAVRRCGLSYGPKRGWLTADARRGRLCGDALERATACRWVGRRALWWRPSKGRSVAS
jgi:hypothetical protein